jgi:cobalt-zinc-cadmium efflux system membrane fusion protein
MTIEARKAYVLIASILMAGCRNHAHEGDDHAHDGREAQRARDDHAGGDEGDLTRLLRISEAGLRRSGIRTEPVRVERLIGGIEVPAEIRVNPNRTAHVTPMVAGQIAEVEVELGDAVEAGQTLATMRSVALGEARSAVANARAAVEVARANFLRQEELKREGIGSQRAYLEAQGDLRSAESDLAAATERLHVYGGRQGRGSATSIRSPLMGVVIRKHATEGEVVSEGSSLFVVSDLSRVWVVGRLYEQDIAAARVGAPAVVSLQAYPGESWDGEVSYVSHTLDPKTRTVDIRVELDNPDGTLRPGLFGAISLSPYADEVAPVPLVPQSAVQHVEGRPLVFVAAEEDGVFRPVFVTLGSTAHGKVEIREGLTEGRRVVVSGAFTLKSELLGGHLSDDHHGH